MKHVEYKEVKDEEDQNIQTNKEENETPKYNEIKITEPLLFWIFMLGLGLFLILIINANIVSIPSQSSKLLLEIGEGIIYIPGAIIFPLITALWIGERIGNTNRKPKSILSSSLLNTAYIFLVYIISILIIFLLIHYVNSSFITLNINDFLIYLVGIPFIILFVLIPILSLLSSVRHNV